MAEEFAADGMADSVRYIADTLLDDCHYKSIYTSLASKWDNHSLSAAVRLMQTYDVRLTPEEEAELAAMDESRQIEALVAKMPQQSNEQFQHFFLQLQLLVSTATQVRRALEAGRPDLVQEALDDAEKTGISSYILRVAIVQAGSEVQTLKQQFDLWMKDADAKMSRYIRGQQDAIVAQRKLAAAQAELTNFTVGQSQKTQKVLLALCGGQGKAVRGVMFNAWEHYWRQQKLERSIAAEYQERIERSEKALAEYKAKQLSNARGVLLRQGMQTDAKLLAEVIEVWSRIPKEAKAEAESKEKLKELEDKLNSCKDQQKENTKKVLARMGMSNDSALLAMTFGALCQNRQDCIREREVENISKEAQEKVEKALGNQRSSARKVLSTITGSSETGCLTTCMRGWVQVWEDTKKEEELARVLNDGNKKFSMFGDRNKLAGKSVMERQTYFLEQMLLLRVFNALRLEGRTGAAMAGYHARIDAKRQQLGNVQQMFMTFAAELENGLKAGETSTRDGKESRKALSKSEGTVSLPNIHKPSSAQGDRPERREPRAANRGTPTGRSQHPEEKQPRREAWS